MVIIVVKKAFEGSILPNSAVWPISFRVLNDFGRFQSKSVFSMFFFLIYPVVHNFKIT